MTSLYDLIQSALASLTKAVEAVDDLGTYEDCPQPAEEFRAANGHIEDAISELEKAKAMTY